jgi:amino acid adenylation domain-containing protein
MKNKNHPDNLEVVANQKIKERNYWLEKLSGEWDKSTFPYSCEKEKKENLPGNDFHSKTFRFSSELFSALMTLSTQKDIKLYIILASGLVLLVNKYNTFSGKGDITIGSPIYQQDIDGEFVNTVLVLRNHLQEEITFKELLMEVRQTIVEANDNCNYPVEVLAKQLGKPYSKEDDFPLFDIVFLLENIQDETYIQHINCNVRLLFKREKEYIEGVLEYNPLLYDKWTIDKIINHYSIIFQNVLFNLDLKLVDLDILSESEKQQILKDFNATQTAYPQDKTIHELFREQAAKTPDGVTIVSVKRGAAPPAIKGAKSVEQTEVEQQAAPFPMDYISITYRELNRRSHQLALLLRGKGILPDTVVGIMADQSLEVIIGILGILTAGGAYLPVDPYYPQERVNYNLNDSNARILLCEESKVCEVSEGTEVIDLPSLIAMKEDANPTHLTHPSHPTHLAYIIYTSGSTGRPKGVMVEHKNVVRLVKNTNYIHFREGDRLLQTGAVEFDASTFEIWGPLLNGLSLYFVPKEEILSTEQLREVLQKYDIGTMWLTSPLFNQLSGVDIEIFKGLRILLVGGDVLSPVHINKLRNRFPQLNIINGYGPTENTTFSTTFLITQEYKERIPIGKPIANSTVYIVDEAGGLLPVGVPGELWVGGDGVSRGYMNNPELTAEKFILAHGSWLIADRREKKNGSSGEFPMSYLYKTGDLARWLPDGNIDFIGRIDQQVKVRGFRIELGEIKNQLLKIKGISEAVVIDRKDHTNQKYLCAYIVSELELNSLEIKDTLGRRLPAYMIPAYVMQVDHIPLTPNGKVDRSALPAPALGLNASDNYVAPGNENEEKMVEIWAEILNLDKQIIGVKNNFFELGGDSLKATILTAKIHKVFNVRMPLEEIFRTPTVEGICSLISVTNWAREQNREMDVPSDIEEEIIL